MDKVNDPQIGIVVPTLGTRPVYLEKALQSIRAAGDCHIVIVAPDPETIRANYSSDLFDQIIQDPKAGLAEAINIGMRSLPKYVRFVNWLGDDDLLKRQSLVIASRALEDSPGSICVYGGCSYIGPNEEVLWVNRSGKYAKWLMRFGPQLIPQPGMLFDVQAFYAVGGLDSTYKWAFDLDLLLKFSKFGKLLFVPEILSSFRWHEGSLSVGGRHGSVTEASKIRRKSLPRLIQFLSPIWEFFIQYLILGAGYLLSARSRKLAKVEVN